jgi:hypothetical protein
MSDSRGNQQWGAIGLTIELQAWLETWTEETVSEWQINCEKTLLG